MGVWMSIVRVIANDGSACAPKRIVRLTTLNGATPAGDRRGHKERRVSRGVPALYPGPSGRIHENFGRHECSAHAVTVGSPTPITFSRRDSAVKANSFISWLE